MSYLKKSPDKSFQLELTSSINRSFHSLFHLLICLSLVFAFCALIDLVSDSLFSVNSSSKTPNQVKPTKGITDYCLMVIVQRKVEL